MKIIGDTVEQAKLMASELASAWAKHWFTHAPRASPYMAGGGGWISKGTRRGFWGSV